MSEKTNLTGAEFHREELVDLFHVRGSKPLAAAAERSTKNNAAITDQIPHWQRWRQEAQAIKEHTVDNLDKLLIEFERNATARGIEVLWAADAEEANRMVLEITEQHNVRSVVKGKSMVSEELGLNEVLEAEGIESLETDLGEYIIQLAGQRPTHIVTPALHLSAGEIGQLFADKLDEPLTEEHEALTMIARQKLREKFLAADLGFSGTNFMIADTGGLAIVENEGNVGLSTTVPPVHIALIGMEKIIPSVDHVPLFLNLLTRVGTGQKLTSYTHMVHGPAPGKKMYVIIVDNGRSKILADPESRSSLKCIRCGMCLNVCPVYRRVGGWAYGWVYPGPIGSIIVPHLQGMDNASKLPVASSLCGACEEVCPVRMNIPEQMVYLRHLANEGPERKLNLAERLLWRGWSWAMGGPLRYKLAMTAAGIGSKFVKFLPWKPWLLGAWARGRDIPQSDGPLLRRRMKKLLEEDSESD